MSIDVAGALRKLGLRWVELPPAPPRQRITAVDMEAARRVGRALVGGGRAPRGTTHTVTSLGGRLTDYPNRHGSVGSAIEDMVRGARGY